MSDPEVFYIWEKLAAWEREGLAVLPTLRRNCDAYVPARDSVTQVEQWDESMVHPDKCSTCHDQGWIPVEAHAEVLAEVLRQAGYLGLVVWSAEGYEVDVHKPGHPRLVAVHPNLLLALCRTAEKVMEALAQTISETVVYMPIPLKTEKVLE